MKGCSMKVFFSKLKKANIIMKIFYFLSLIFYWGSYGFFCKSVLSLAGIETVIRIVVLIFAAIFGIIYTVFGLIKIFQNKKVGFIILTVFTLLFSVVFGFASYYIDRLYNKLENFTAKENSIYTTAIVTLISTNFDESSTIGMITDEEDRTGYILPLEMISKNKLNNPIEYYSNTLEMLDALYAGEIDAIFITDNYIDIYSTVTGYESIATDTKILLSKDKKMKKSDTSSI